MGKTGSGLARGAWVLLLLAFTGCQPAPENTEPAGSPAAARAQAEPAAPLPECQWCGADEAPAELGWSITLAGPEEPGERLILTGTVFEADGTTPVAEILMYTYHTDVNGLYTKKGDETGNGRRHGYLRGWLKTGADGRYRIDTIRPAAYPSRTEPQHVHMTLRRSGGEEFWIDSVMFDDDELLTEEVRSSRENRGGSGITTPRQDQQGVWHATRDIVLPAP